MAKAKRMGEKVARAAKQATKRPKAQRLPEMEDAAIPDIEATADAYIETRDARMALTEEEVNLKGALRMAMGTHRKSVYRRTFDDETVLEVIIVPGDDRVKASKKKIKNAA